MLKNLFVYPAFSSFPLIKTLANREKETSTNGTVLGGLWNFLLPLIQISIYTFVFAFVFKVRWGQSAVPAESALKIFLGLSLFGLFAECVNAAPSLILYRRSFVTKLVFPLEILPYVTLWGAMRVLMLNLCLFVFFYSVCFREIPWNLVVVFVLFLPVILYALGLLWFLSSLGVFLRDIRNIVPVIVNILMFLSPIFYPAGMFPKDLAWLQFFNPIGFLIEQARLAVFSSDATLNWPVWGGLFLLGLCVSQLGYIWFMKTKRGFADVL